MKSLINYISERLVIFPSQVDERLVIFPSQVNERLVVNKDYNDPYTCAPASWEELRKIIEDRYYKLGPGTKQKPIDFNDVDVSNIDSFYNKDTNNGIFDETKFEYIDISDWDVSNVKNMMGTFYGCKNLKSVGDLSKWNVSKVKNMSYMFHVCVQLKSVGDLSNWNVSKVKNTFCMFMNSGITNKPDWLKK